MSNILLVDDNLNNMYLFHYILERQGYVVTEAYNGQEAVDKALADNFDLVLMDIQMPVKDGITATREILQKKPDQLIVAVSARVMQTDLALVEEVGFAGFIEKPIEPQNFAALVKKYLSDV